MDNHVKLFISNLAPDVTDKDLLTLLPDKTVIKAFIALSDKKESRCFGFITVRKEDVPAYLNLDSKMFKGRDLVINHAVDKEDKINTIKFFVRNLSYTATKAELRELLVSQGILPINIVVVQKPDEDGILKSRGFGFILVYKKDEEKILKLNDTKFKNRSLSIIPYKEMPNERNKRMP